MAMYTCKFYKILIVSFYTKNVDILGNNDKSNESGCSTRVFEDAKLVVFFRF